MRLISYTHHMGLLKCRIPNRRLMQANRERLKETTIVVLIN